MSEKVEKQYLTDEELEKYSKLYSHELPRSLHSDLLQRMKNSIEQMEAEFNSMKGLKSFVKTGVLVTPKLIISANPDEHGIDLGMSLTALGGGRYADEAARIVNVSLRVEDVKRLIKLLPELLKVARLYKTFNNLKKIYKDKTLSQRRGYY